jgi:flavin reductase (DIM6/NTAB) family NADH-FMN oxidoreductase RutF
VSPDNRQFRNALGQFATGVAIVTTVTPEGERIGMTVSSFNSLSLDPALVLFSIHRQAHSFATWQQAKHFALDVLNEGQEELSNRFATAKTEKWAGLNPRRGKTGVPLVPNAIVSFECEAYARYAGGDHDIFVGLVVEFHENMAKRDRPLVFYGGRYRQLVAGGAHAPPGEADLMYGW